MREMSSRVVFLLLAVLLCLDFIYGAPNPLSVEKQELVERFVEFIQQDKGLAKFLAEEENLQLTRNKRAADNFDDMDGTMSPADAEKAAKEAGFMDRAARFVMELMQRFLKWINE